MAEQFNFFNGKPLEIIPIEVGQYRLEIPKRNSLFNEILFSTNIYQVKFIFSAKLESSEDDIIYLSNELYNSKRVVTRKEMQRWPLINNKQENSLTKFLLWLKGKINA